MALGGKCTLAATTKLFFLILVVHIFIFYFLKIQQIDVCFLHIKVKEVVHKVI